MNDNAASLWYRIFPGIPHRYLIGLRKLPLSFSEIVAKSPVLYKILPAHFDLGQASRLRYLPNDAFLDKVIEENPE
jgi:hypothetical protein